MTLVVRDGFKPLSEWLSVRLFDQRDHGELDLVDALGAIGARFRLQTRDVEAHRFQGVHHEGIADCLHVVIEDLEQRGFDRGHERLADRRRSRQGHSLCTN